MCGGTHRSANCPDRADRRMARARLNAVLTQGPALPLIKEVPHNHPTSSLNALQAKESRPGPRPLLFVDCKLNGIPV